MRRSIFLIGLLIILTFNPVFSTPTTSPEKTDNFLSISDIHFNPFATCNKIPWPCPLLKQLRQAPYTAWESIFEHEENKNLSTYSYDTNYALLKSALEQIHQINQQEQPNFTLILGDFLAHQFRPQYILYSGDVTLKGYQDFVKKTLQFLTFKIRQAIPQGDIYPVIGNNDSYSGNYTTIPSGQFFQDLTEIWAPFIKDKLNQNNFKENFPLAGYYVVTLPTNKNQKIIILNSVLFSHRAKGPHGRTAAQNELTWLHKELKQISANQQNTFIALHIPVGIDVYATLQSLFTHIKEFWQPQYSAIFREDLENFSRYISAVLPGHLHNDSFQLLTFQPDAVTVSFTPSISPIYDNNPGFKIYRYHPQTLQLQNFDTYYLPLQNGTANTTRWGKEYSFNQVYQATCKDCHLEQGMKQLTLNTDLVSFYKKYYSVSGKAQPISEHHNWIPYYWCNISHITRESYKTCLFQLLDFSHFHNSK